MILTKKWYKSKTIIGAIISVACGGANLLLGLNVDEAAQAQLVEYALQVASLGGAIYAWYGRVVAKAEIA